MSNKKDKKLLESLTKEEKTKQKDCAALGEKYDSLVGEYTVKSKDYDGLIIKINDAEDRLELLTARGDELEITNENALTESRDMSRKLDEDAVAISGANEQLRKNVIAEQKEFDVRDRVLDTRIGKCYEAEKEWEKKVFSADKFLAELANKEAKLVVNIKLIEEELSETLALKQKLAEKVKEKEEDIATLRPREVKVVADALKNKQIAADLEARNKALKVKEEELDEDDIQLMALKKKVDRKIEIHNLKKELDV